MQWEPYEQKDAGIGETASNADGNGALSAHLAGAGGGGAGRVCMRSLETPGTGLYLSMRFLDVALSSLYFAPDPSVEGAEDRRQLSLFQMESLAAM